jgi:type I restriction enzyme, S subunit
MIESIFKGFDIWTNAQGVKSKGKVQSINNISHEGIERLRQLILSLAFSGKLNTQDSKDEPATEILKRIRINHGKRNESIKSENVKQQIPNSWQWCQIGGIANHNTGKTLDSGRNKGILRDYITTSNLYWGYFKLEGVKSMAISDEEIDRFTAERGDLLICEGGDSGRSAVWESENSICFQNHIHRVRLLEGINPYYLYYYMMKIYKTGEIQDYRKGIGISSISGKALSSIQVPLAPNEEQKRIINRIEELFTICDNLEEQQTTNLTTHHYLVKSLLETVTNAADAAELQTAWEKLSEHFDTLFCTEDSIEQLKQTILQVAIMGRLVKQDANDEPAIELIKRIKTQKEKLIEAGKLKRQNELPEVLNDEMPYSIPKGWEWTRLGIISQINPRNECDDTANVSFVPMSLITTSYGGEHSQEERRWSEVKSGFTHIADGDIAIAKITPCFENSKAAIFSNLKNSFGAATTELHVARPFGKTLNAQYVLYNLKAPIYLRIGESKMTGTAGQKRVPREFFSSYPFPLPPLAEQHRIVLQVNKLFDLCDNLSKRIIQNQKIQNMLSRTVIESVNA